MAVRKRRPWFDVWKVLMPFRRQCERIGALVCVGLGILIGWSHADFSIFAQYPWLIKEFS